MSSTAPLPPLPDPYHRNLHWRVIQFVLQNVFCFWLGYRARGGERLATIRGGLVLSNHQSFLDPLLIGLPLQRPVSFMARDSLFRVPVIGWILRNTYVMPINREAASTASLREAIRRLEHGYLVGVFPEGTRSVSGAIGEFKPGFLSLVRRTDQPIIPVGIAGADRALPRGAWCLWPARVRVVFGEPIAPAELAPYSGRGQEAALIDFVRQRVIAEQQEAEHWCRDLAMETASQVPARSSSDAAS